MENGEVSGFISIKSSDNIEILDNGGATSMTYKLRMDGRTYFVKQLRPELRNDARYREIFTKEYNTGKSIKSPYIVEYVDIKEGEYGPYILMEYVNGVTLKEKIEAEPEYFSTEANLKKFMLQLCEALHTAHSNNVIHLDINPNNILVSRANNDIKLIDWGFSTSDYDDCTPGSTSEFGAPEAICGNVEKIDARTDIYSVGRLLQFIEQKSNKKLPHKFRRIMERCLKEEKSRRYPQASDIIREINKNNVRRTAAAAIATALVALSALFLWLGNNPEERIQIRGVDYKVLSHKELTCAVTGGNGEKGNIYIAANVNLNGQTYRTVSIADNAFNSKEIRSIYIPEGIEHIGDSVLHSNNSIVSISLPNSIKDIRRAFINMNGLQRIKLPQGCKTIGTGAFVDCDTLDNVFVPEGVERIELDAFAACNSLKNISLPSTLKVIERGVFWRCSALEQITIPKNVEEIGEYAFYWCDNLKDIYLYATTPPDISTIINDINITIHVPAASIEAYNSHPVWSGYILSGDL